MRILLLVFTLLVLGCSSSKNEEVENIQTISEEKNAPKKEPAEEVKEEKPKPLKPDTYKAYLLEYGKNNPETKVKLTTKQGEIILKLYDDTPLHRANFIMLCKRNYLTGTYFYRVLKGFMIQGGNTNLELTMYKRQAIGSYKLDAEINPDYFHRRGVLAMAKDPNYFNPKKQSSAYSFYIVQGKKMTDQELNITEKDYRVKIPTNRRKIYETIGGSPHLDGDFTIFGEVIKGMEVVDKIADLEVDNTGWPAKEDVVITAEVLD